MVTDKAGLTWAQPSSCNRVLAFSMTSAGPSAAQALRWETSKNTNVTGLVTVPNIIRTKTERTLAMILVKPGRVICVENSSVHEQAVRDLFNGLNPS